VLSLVKSTASSGGGNFLIPNGTIIVELVIFVITLGLIAKFVLPPLQKVMDEREERIRNDQLASDAGSAEASQLDAERQRVLDAARAEARTLLAEATEQAAALVAEGRERGLREFERRVAEVVAQVAGERGRVESELFSRLEDLVADAAGRVLGERIDPVQHAAVLESAVAAARAAVAQ
jgi:F-type H+-transporting ATPase subunit b